MYIKTQADGSYQEVERRLCGIVTFQQDATHLVSQGFQRIDQSGVAGWMISEFLAKPFRRAIDLVAEARTSVFVYGNVRARATVPVDRDDGYAARVEITDEDEARLRKAEEALRELGAKMLAFAGTDRAAASLLRVLGTDLHSAGIAMVAYSNSIGTYGQQKHDTKQRVEATLGIPQN